jgi:hypothetical protein
MDANERRTRAGADAAEWWLRIQLGQMTRDERGQLIAWLRESAIHVAEMLRIAQVHNALEQFDRWANIGTEGSAEETVLEFPNRPPDLSLAVPPGPQGRGTDGGSPRRISADDRDCAQRVAPEPTGANDRDGAR